MHHSRILCFRHAIQQFIREFPKHNMPKNSKDAPFIVVFSIPKDGFFSQAEIDMVNAMYACFQKKHAHNPKLDLHVWYTHENHFHIYGENQV